MIGMRERAGAAGGTITTEMGTNGTYTVHAVLPLPRPGPGSPIVPAGEPLV